MADEVDVAVLERFVQGDQDAYNVFTIQWQFALPMFPVGMTIYYLAWKYFVGLLNKEMGIA